MTLTVRTPSIDLSQGFDRHWYGGSRAITHAFNAFSWMFPKGEQFFIDAVKAVTKESDLASHPRLAREIQSFVSQELTHSHIHKVYNQALEAQGFENVVEPAIIRLSEFSKKYFSAQTNLALVSAYEHYTAVMGDFLLKNPKLLRPAKKELALVWGWHAVEETEHKAVCFDLYTLSGGGWVRRVLTFFSVSVNFTLLYARAYLTMLYHDKALHPKNIFRTLTDTVPFFWGRRGLMWHILFHGVAYLSPWFHPWKYDNSADALEWIEKNSASFKS